MEQIDSTIRLESPTRAESPESTSSFQSSERIPDSDSENAQDLSSDDQTIDELMSQMNQDLYDDENCTFNFETFYESTATMQDNQQMLVNEMEELVKSNRAKDLKKVSISFVKIENRLQNVIDMLKLCENLVHLSLVDVGL